MNPYTGEIERFSSSKRVPEGWIELTEDEARELLPLPRDLRIERFIKKLRRTDKCKVCGCFIGNHSPRVFKEHAADELAKFETARLEAMLAPESPFDSLPERKLEDMVYPGGKSAA